MPGVSLFQDSAAEHSSESSPHHFYDDPLSAITSGVFVDSSSSDCDSPMLSKAADGLSAALDLLVAKTFEKQHGMAWEGVEFEAGNVPSSPDRSRSSSSLMWATQDQRQSRMTASDASLFMAAPVDYFESPVSLDLFALECSSSGEDGLDGDHQFDSLGSKRKLNLLETIECKKVRALHRRDNALFVESQALINENPECKRITHNVLERKRRNDLKSSYQELRENIPELVPMDRAPTATILQKAVEFITEMNRKEELMLATIAQLRSEGNRLRAQLDQA